MPKSAKKRKDKAADFSVIYFLYSELANPLTVLIVESEAQAWQGEAVSK